MSVIALSSPEGLTSHAFGSATLTPLWWRVLILAAIVTLTAVAWHFRDAVGVRGQACFGVICFLGIAAAFSADLRRVNWRTIVTGLALQFVLALLILRLPVVYRGFRGNGPSGCQVSRLRECGSGVCLRSVGQARRHWQRIPGGERRNLRFSRIADDHLRRVFLHGPLSLADFASGGLVVRQGHALGIRAERDQRGGGSGGVGECVHGPNGGAAHHQAVCGDHDPVGIARS